MPEFTSNAEHIINEIRSLRWVLLPPYAYNEDEDEKSTAEYIEFYSNYISECIKAATLYEEGLKKFSKDVQSLALFQELLLMRKAFIQHFPFCYDELDPIANREQERFVEYMRSIYMKESILFPLMSNVSKYSNLLRNLIAL